MEKPLLSICIPTYNRCSYLKNSLNSIICQKEFREGRVEIVISDNVSTDGTQAMAEEYAARYGNIRYFRNSENLVDKNFPLALSRGKGLFRKLSNDTFLYLPGSLSYLCRLLQENLGTDKVLFFVNRRYLKSATVKCSGLEQFICTTGVFTIWSGAFGLWENECEKVTRDFSGCELHLWHCKRIYEMVEAKGEAFIVDKKLVLVQEVDGKSMSYGLYQVFYLNFLSILNSYVEKGRLMTETCEKMRMESLCLLAFLLNHGKQRIIKWDLADEEKIKESVFCEAKQLGRLDDYQKHFNKMKFSVPLRTCFKIFLQNIYSAFFSARIRFVEEKQ